MILTLTDYISYAETSYQFFEVTILIVTLMIKIDDVILTDSNLVWSVRVYITQCMAQILRVLLFVLLQIKALFTVKLKTKN